MKNPEFTRRVCMRRGVGLFELAEELNRYLPVWQKNILPSTMLSDRDTSVERVIWVRDNEGPDVELLGVSVENLKKTKIDLMSIEELFQYNIDRLKETGQPLDAIATMTLCGGSSIYYGLVPLVFHYGGEVSILWVSPNYSTPNAGCRKVLV
jgi:hypothetical protein